VDGSAPVRCRDWFLSVLLSIIVHGVCLLAVAYLLYRSSVLPVLFVDLASDPEVGAPAPPSRPESRSPGQRAPTHRPKARSQPDGASLGLRPEPHSREPYSKEEPAPARDALGMGLPTLAGSDERSIVARPEPTGKAEDRQEPIAASVAPMGVGAVRPGSDTPSASPSAGSPGGAEEGPGHGPGADVRALMRGIPGGADGKTTQGGEGRAAGGVLPPTADGVGNLALATKGGGGGGAGPEYGPYLTLWRTRIHQSVPYPLAARRRSLTGTVQIEILIEPSGAVGGVKLVESSSHGVLDAAVLESVKQLPPLPFPPHLVPRTIRARLPVVFEMR
jgi:TonB family protein